MRVVAGAPVGPDATPPAARPGLLWFAHESTPRLWWQRLREHLTPRSVYFQGALRLAAALAVGPAARRRARPLARVLGAADDPHPAARLGGRDPLAAVAGAGRHADRLASLAAALLVADIPPTALRAGPPAGHAGRVRRRPAARASGWAQALFTLVIALVFAQVSPVDWHLAEARVLDVAVGAAIGPGHRAARLAARRLRRAAPRCRDLPRGRRPGSSGETVDVLARGAPSRRPRCRRHASRRARLGLVGAVPDRAPPAGLGRLAGHAARRAPRRPRGRGLRRECPTGRLLPCVAAAHRRGGRRRGPLRAGRRRAAAPRPRPSYARHRPTHLAATGPRTSAPTCTTSPTCTSGSTGCATTSAASSVDRRSQRRTGPASAGGPRLTGCVRASGRLYVEYTGVHGVADGERGAGPPSRDPRPGRGGGGDHDHPARSPGRRAAAAGRRPRPAGRAPSTGRGRSAGCWRRPGIARCVPPP